MVIAIIDDVLQIEHINKQNSISLYKVLNGKLESVEKSQSRKMVNVISHSTLCSMIILSADVQVIHIQIYDKEKNARIDDLITALNFCVQKKVDIISLSIGSTKLSDWMKIKKLFSEIKSIGIIVVAAQCNQNMITIPVCLENVIGVASTESIGRNICCVEENRWGINLLVPLKQYLPSELAKRKDVVGNSYAVPIIIREFCKYAETRRCLPTIEILNSFLEQYSVIDVVSINKEMRRQHTSVQKVPYIFWKDENFFKKNLILEVMNGLQKKYGIETICIVYDEPTDVRFIRYGKDWIEDDINNNFYSKVDLIMVAPGNELDNAIKKEIDITVTIEDNSCVLTGENEERKRLYDTDNSLKLCDTIVEMLSE